MHKNAVKPDQVLWTVTYYNVKLGPIAATIKMVEELGGIVVGTAFFIGEGLKRPWKIKDYDIFKLMEY